VHRVQGLEKNRHPFVVYADFESLLMKTDQEKGTNTKIIHRHKHMSYGFWVKASEDVPDKLSVEHEIPSDPVI